MPVMPLSKEMEIFADQVAAQPTHAAKLEWMQKALADPNFIIMFQWAFCPMITFNRLPAGYPTKFKPEDIGENEGFLKHAIFRRKHVYFIDGTNDGIRDAKLQLMWLNFLESCYPSDRVLLVNAVQKKFPFDGITYDLVREAYLDHFTADWPVSPGGLAPVAVETFSLSADPVEPSPVVDVATKTIKAVPPAEKKLVVKKPASKKVAAKKAVA